MTCLTTLLCFYLIEGGNSLLSSSTYSIYLLEAKQFSVSCSGPWQTYGLTIFSNHQIPPHWLVICTLFTYS